jgi:large subunit ribosomal protein L10
MALKKSEKDSVVAEVAELFSTSKMTVIAQFQGTTVKALQTLRKDAKQNGTKVKVVKNRLVIKAIQQNDILKGADVSTLQGMLLYAFNSNDEVAAAADLNNFAKKNPTIQFVGGISADGLFVDAGNIKALAGLPSKNQLIAETIAMLLSPVHDITNALSGNLHALLEGIADAKAA